MELARQLLDPPGARGAASRIRSSPGTSSTERSGQPSCCSFSSRRSGRRRSSRTRSWRGSACSRTRSTWSTIPSLQQTLSGPARLARPPRLGVDRAHVRGHPGAERRLRRAVRAHLPLHRAALPGAEGALRLVIGAAPSRRRRTEAAANATTAIPEMSESAPPTSTLPGRYVKRTVDRPAGTCTARNA